MDEWDEEELEELWEKFQEYAQGVLDQVASVYDELEAKYIAEHLNESLSAGGELYNQMVDYAIASAEQWYALYTPMHYKRRHSLTNPANIGVSSSLNVSGSSVSGSVKLTNYSDQAQYAISGFWIYTRGGRIWRPGGLEDGIPEEIPVDVDTSDVSKMLTEQAWGAVL